eukprot:TRINITY_DN689_c0_g1_i1.p1 TRINITY_DN689_c0_g1~~TRINITY_DN689_c0_g1_i1.p1  ORF type:complete len:116 (+),score=22.26 TRINITY_DN689_c0_g1_i1:149-496(+)
MPLVRVLTNIEVDDKRSVCDEIIIQVAGTIGKLPERVMVCIMDRVSITFGGSDSPSASVSVLSLGGLSQEVNGKVTNVLNTILLERLGIPMDRVYVEFDDHARDMMSFNGRTLNL